ncbi:MAG TPA: hypothetical protein VFA52_04355 [Candidatus Paceibacterota bacterium]|nr:hypothetical protein [Candidatus Paceibacterota bacterium]
MDYLIEFEAHIDERKRPDGFPHSVFVRETYPEISSEQELKEIFNSRFKNLVMNPGLVVFRDDSIIDKNDYGQRMYVPWHMITHLHGRISPITSTKSEFIDPDLEMKKNGVVT